MGHDLHEAEDKAEDDFEHVLFLKLEDLKKNTSQQHRRRMATGNIFFQKNECL
jgi:hypothetical protein